MSPGLTSYSNEPRTRRSWFASSNSRSESSEAHLATDCPDLKSRHSFLATSSQPHRISKAQISQTLTSYSTITETHKNSRVDGHPALETASVTAPSGHPVDSVIGTLPATSSSSSHQSLWQRANCLRRSLVKTASNKPRRPTKDRLVFNFTK